MPSLTVNVLEFGAAALAPDAVDAIQAAIDFISPTGGTVYIPPGVYTISQALDLRDNVHLKGAGANLTTLKLELQAGGKPPLTHAQYLHNAACVLRVAGKTGVRVSHLAIDGNKRLIDGSQGSNPFLQTLGYPDGGLQAGIAVVGDPPYVSLAPDVKSSYCTIEDCRVYHCVDDGIQVDHAHHIQIRNCSSDENGILPPAPDFVSVQGDGSTHPFGINLWQDTEHCLIEGCSAHKNPHAGICVGSETSRYHLVRYCATDSIDVSHFLTINVANPAIPAESLPLPVAVPVHLTIVGCVVNNSGQAEFMNSPSACFELGIVSHLTIRDCHCVVKYNAGIRGHLRRLPGYDPHEYAPQDTENNPRDNIIVNNRIQNVAGPASGAQSPGSAIDLGDWESAVVSGNTVDSESTFGILLVRCRQVVLAGNTVAGRELGARAANPLQGNGIGLYGCKEVSVSANCVRGFNLGIIEVNLGEPPFGVVPCENNLITGNILKDNWKPIGAALPGASPGTGSAYQVNLPVDANL